MKTRDSNRKANGKVRSQKIRFLDWVGGMFGDFQRETLESAIQLIWRMPFTKQIDFQTQALITLFFLVPEKPTGFLTKSHNDQQKDRDTTLQTLRSVEASILMVQKGFTSSGENQSLKRTNTERDYSTKAWPSAYAEEEVHNVHNHLLNAIFALENLGNLDRALRSLPTKLHELESTLGQNALRNAIKRIESTLEAKGFQLVRPSKLLWERRKRARRRQNNAPKKRPQNH